MSTRSDDHDQSGDARPQPPAPARRDPLVSRSSDDLPMPGVVVEVTPEEARAMGAFDETALSAEDAWESNADVGTEAGAEDDVAGANARRGGRAHG